MLRERSRLLVPEGTREATRKMARRSVRLGPTDQRRILSSVFLTAVLLLSNSVTVSASFAFGPFVDNSRQARMATSPSLLHSQQQPLSRLFRVQSTSHLFESPSSSAAAAQTTMDSPHPPLTPPPQDLLEPYHGVEHAVPFFLLDRDDVLTEESPAAAAADSDDDLSDNAILDVTATADDESFSSWTVVQLKAELKRRGLPVSGKKALLVERLETSLQQQVTQTVVPSSTSASTTATQAAWNTVLDPWMQARLEKGVEMEAIQGALVAGTALTAVASKSVAVSSVVGMLAAYTAITEGSVGQWTRQVGRVVWDAVLAATEVAKQVDGAPVQFLGQSLQLVGTLVNKTMASVESGIAAASLAQNEEAAQRREQDEAAMRLAQTKQTAFLRQLMVQRFEYDAVTRARLESEAKAAAQQRQTAFLQQLMTVRFELQAKETAARLEELSRQVEAARVAEENERLLQAQLIQERVRMEEEAKAAVAAEAAEAARIAEENERLLQAQLIEERARMEEEAKAIAAAEAARMAAEAAPEMVENEISEQDWMESIRVAQQSIEGKMAGFDEEDLYVDQKEKDSWEKAEQLAKQLGQESADEEDLDNFDIDSLDLGSVGDAARAAVEEFEKMRDPAIKDEVGPTGSSEWSSLTIAQLRTECKARGLSSAGKKAELVARLEEPSAAIYSDRPNGFDIEDVDDFDLDSIDLDAVGNAARAAVEEFERMRSPVDDEQLSPDSSTSFALLTMEQLRDECKARGLSPLGKKVDLIARLEGATAAASNEEVDSDDDLDDIDLDSFDINAVGDAARAAVEEFERMRQVNGASLAPSSEQDWSSLTLPELRSECRERGLATDGKKIDLVGRLEDFESISLFSTDEDLLDDSEASLDFEEPDVIDWNTLTLKELQKELQDRNLPTTGRKADLVATLEAFTSTDNYVDETDLDSDLEELALRFGSGSDSDGEDSGDDLDLDFDNIDIDAIGQAARQAADLFSIAQVDEPSDEDLWEIEAMALPDGDDFDGDLGVDIVPSVASLDASTIIYAKMTVNELKEELRYRNLSVTGKKTELIERLLSADSTR